MDLQLVGKRALVTGSTAGIGLATASGLFRELRCTSNADRSRTKQGAGGGHSGTSASFPPWSRRKTAKS
jgi:NAD(P)-dependent dehydrogenase (short-subunit alcohol dehydrogenase family)